MDVFKDAIIKLIEEQWHHLYDRREDISNMCTQYENKVVETNEDKLSHRFYRGLWTGVQDSMCCLEGLKRKIEKM